MSTVVYTKELELKHRETIMNQLSLLIYVYSKFGTDGRGLDESTKQSKACVGSDRAVEDYSARLQGKSN
jgi:hypothetical protein